VVIGLNDGGLSILYFQYSHRSEADLSPQDPPDREWTIENVEWKMPMTGLKWYNSRAAKAK
jgi:hypothetical protein